MWRTHCDATLIVVDVTDEMERTLSKRAVSYVSTGLGWSESYGLRHWCHRAEWSESIGRWQLL